jgi:hypothetical protein
VTVVSRTTKAINYGHLADPTKVGLKGTVLMTDAQGEARVESKRGAVEIEAKVNHLGSPTRFGPEYLTYVLWAVTPYGRPRNLGEVVLNGSIKSKLDVTTELQAFGLIVTAEPYFAVTMPSDVVVLENEIRADTVGKVEEIDANVAAGPLSIRAGVSPANVDRAIASIDEEVTRLLRDGLTPKELDESRRYLIGSIPRSLETNAAIANFLQVEEFFGLGLDYDARLPDLLKAVTLDDANAAARRVQIPIARRSSSRDPTRTIIQAVLFDVDFTLIYPGRCFAARIPRVCRPLRHGHRRVEVRSGVASAAPVLHSPDDVYDPEIFIAYTSHIIQQMGGTGPRIDECSREIYDDGPRQHFELCDDVPAVLQQLADAGLRVGLISNTHRCLASFQSISSFRG